MQFSYDAAWNDVVATFRRRRELILVLAGVFILLPTAAQLFFIPPPEVAANDPRFVQKMMDYVTDNGVVWFLLSLPVLWGTAALIHVAFAENAPRDAAIGAGFRSLFWLLLLSYVMQFALMAGFLLLIAPGLYLLGRFCVASSALVLEGRRNPFAALARSMELTRGQGWRLCGFLLIVVLVLFVAYLAVLAIIGGLFSLILPAAAAKPALALLQATGTTVLNVVPVLLGVAIYRQLAGEASRDAAVFE